VLLQNISDNVIAGLRAEKANLKAHPDIVVNLVQQDVLPYVDKRIMIRTVLGRTGYTDWKAADVQVQQKFEKQFTDLIVGTYVAALQSFDNEEVKVIAPRQKIGDETHVRLQAKIINKDGPPVAMTYVLRRDAGHWKIIDFSVEGISLIQSYQSQFQEILSQGGGLSHLIEKLDKHEADQKKG
jgi:phospholipid transport system substrate-binding protein